MIFRYHTEKKNEYEIDFFLRQNGQRYFIKWKNYDETENIWDPLKIFGNCQIFLRQFHQTKRTSFLNQQKNNYSDTILIKKMKSGKKISTIFFHILIFQCSEIHHQSLFVFFFSIYSIWRSKRCFAYDFFNSISKLQNRPLLKQTTHFPEISTIRHGFGTNNNKQFLQRGIA